MIIVNWQGKGIYNNRICSGKVVIPEYETAQIDYFQVMADLGKRLLINFSDYYPDGIALELGIIERGQDLDEDFL